MPTYELILQKDGQNVSRFRVGDKAIVIGRASDSDIVLPDRMISRRHARLQVVGDRLTVEDLGSTNGIVVNGQAVRQHTVREGDEIYLAKYNVLVERTGVQKQLTDTGAFISFDSAGRVVKQIVEAPGSERLAALYRASELVSRNLSDDDLMAATLDIIFEVLPVGRGFVMTKHAEEDEADIRVSRFTGRETRSLPLSKTLMDYVFVHRSSVLTSNAKMDERFDDAKSIFDYGIESAMCVPLAGHSDIIGAIYVDAESDKTEFTQDDLELLTAIGRVIGTAVENAWLQEERVQQARLAAIGEALASVSHCMRNVLQGLRIAEETMEDAVMRRAWEPAEESWSNLRHHLTRFDKLVRDLLSYSRDEQLNIEPVALDGLVDEVFQILSSYAAKAGVRLLRDDEPMGTCDCDRQQLYRVLLNLVMNGVDACMDRDEGEVFVSAWRNQFGVYIEIEDNGLGIPEGHLSKISQAFFTTKGSRGTGLGLPCSNKLVDAHGGKIIIDSDTDKGSKFTVFLPVRTKDEAAVPVTSPG